MGVLQNEFERCVKDRWTKASIISGVLRRALKRRSIELSDAKLEAAAAVIAQTPNVDVISIEAEGPETNVQISSGELIASLKELENDVSSGVEETIERTLADIPSGVLSSLYADAPAALRHNRGQQRQFQNRLYKRWKEGIDRLEMMIMIAQEAGDVYVADIQQAGESEEADDEEYLLDALIRIHVRSCRIASEVLCLLRGGFADGAMARWRSLHENAVTAMFLAQYGNRAAERYLRHSAVEQYHASKQYQEHCRALGEEPLSDLEVDEIRRDYESAVLEFGPDFKSEYGWAAEALGTSSPRFAMIERHLDMSRWRPYFKLACQSVHAGPHGLFFSLSVPEHHTSTLAAGASNAGLCDPGHSTAISFLMVSAATFTVRSNLDSLVTMRVMMQLCDDIGKAFLDAHQQLSAEIDECEGEHADGVADTCETTEA